MEGDLVSTIIATTRERQDAAVRLEFSVEVPTSANQGEVLGILTEACDRRQGVTILMPDGRYKVDVELLRVQEVHP